MNRRETLKNILMSLVPLITGAKVAKAAVVVPEPVKSVAILGTETNAYYDLLAKWKGMINYKDKHTPSMEDWPMKEKLACMKEMEEIEFKVRQMLEKHGCSLNLGVVGYSRAQEPRKEALYVSCNRFLRVAMPNIRRKHSNSTDPNSANNFSYDIVEVDGGEIFSRYIDNTTGHVYEIALDNPTNIYHSDYFWGHNGISSEETFNEYIVHKMNPAGDLSGNDAWRMVS